MFSRAYPPPPDTMRRSHRRQPHRAGVTHTAQNRCAKPTPAVHHCGRCAEPSTDVQSATHTSTDGQYLTPTRAVLGTHVQHRARSAAPPSRNTPSTRTPSTRTQVRHPPHSAHVRAPPRAYARTHTRGGVASAPLINERRGHTPQCPPNPRRRAGGGVASGGGVPNGKAWPRGRMRGAWSG